MLADVLFVSTPSIFQIRLLRSQLIATYSTFIASLCMDMTMQCVHANGIDSVDESMLYRVSHENVLPNVSDLTLLSKKSGGDLCTFNLCCVIYFYY